MLSGDHGSLVTPAVADVGHDLGELLVWQVSMGGHDKRNVLDGLSVKMDFPRETMDDGGHELLGLFVDPIALLESGGEVD